MRIAILADIHGNRWALEAVLARIAEVGATRVVNLGDCFFGPLDPAGTFELLRDRGWPTVRGNQDRALLEGSDNPTARYTAHSIGAEGIEWLRVNGEASVTLGDLHGVHGTPGSDEEYFLERVGPHGIRLASTAELSVVLRGVPADATLVACAHSHRPALVAVGDRLVVNPGSVGLPAYSADTPHPHGMEAGSPHARWAWAERGGPGWTVSLEATPYDVAPAVAAAERNGRPDWAGWLATGRA